MYEEVYCLSVILLLHTKVKEVVADVDAHVGDGISEPWKLNWHHHPDIALKYYRYLGKSRLRYLRDWASLPISNLHHKILRLAPEPH